MRSLTKEEMKQKAAIAVKLASLREDAETALGIYEEDCGAAFGKLEAAVNLLNEALEEAELFAEDIASDRRGDFDEKSEKWQEGERGSAAEEWISQWEGASFDRVELEQPQEITLDMDACAVLDDLPEEFSF